MTHRTNYLAMLLACLSLGVLNAGIIHSAYGAHKTITEEQKADPNKIHGKVTAVIEASAYTYAEVDTGKKKVWAAGPTTPLKMGDMISFSTAMPMENFHSKSMQRDFPLIYFVGGFVVDKKAATTKAAAIASPHSRIKQERVAKAAKGISKAERGSTIAEIYAHKQNLNGKTIRVRGKVSKFTSGVMGKNWIHIRDSSSPDDLTVTTDGRVAIDDVVIIEGKIGLDKDYGYGYVYPVIVEGARIIKK